MAINVAADASALLRKLHSIFDLSAEEQEAVLGLPMTRRELRADQDIVRDQDRPHECCLVLEGMAFRYKILGAGTRQILSFHIPGDIPDLQSLHLEVMDHSLAALVPTKVAFIKHEVVRAFIRAYPRLGDAFWRDTLIDSAIFRQWMAGMGRQSAYGRIAHLFCEMFVRQWSVGLTADFSFAMPITQAQLGDALGLSIVHVNRTLQELRADGLVSTHKRSMIIEDWAGLQRAGEFDPTYLHVKKVP